MTAPEDTKSMRQVQKALTATREVPNLLSSAPPSHDACLVHIHPAGMALGQRYAVAADPVIIGREDTCTVVVPDGSVSRKHARVRGGPDGRVQVEDLGSTNGTFVNDRRVKSRPLDDGDYLRVGPCIYRFLAGVEVEAAYQQELHRLAVFDPLTGVHNRRVFDEFLALEIERAQRRARPLALVLFDIDQFSAVNDRLGLFGGDAVLGAVAGRLKAPARKDELVARFGEDTFAAVLPETELDAAVGYAIRAVRAVADSPVEFEGRTCPVTVSAGVALLPTRAEEPVAELLRLAEAQLAAAKKAGRNRVAPAPDGDLEMPADAQTVPARKAPR